MPTAGLSVQSPSLPEVVDAAALEENLPLAVREVVREWERSAFREVAGGHGITLAQSVAEPAYADSISHGARVVRLRVPADERGEAEGHAIVAGHAGGGLGEGGLCDGGGAG